MSATSRLCSGVDHQQDRIELPGCSRSPVMPGDPDPWRHTRWATGGDNGSAQRRSRDLPVVNTRGTLQIHPRQTDQRHVADMGVV